MSKTIKQIADELGVSKQAITYRLKQLEATKENGVLATKENGILVVSLVGETLIKSAFSENNRQTFVDKEPPKDHQTFDSEIIDMLRETNETLRNQLKIKDTQIAEMQKLLDQQQQLQLQQQKSIPVMTEKLSWWNKIFKK